MEAQENTQIADINQNNLYPNVYEHPEALSADIFLKDVEERVEIVVQLGTKTYDSFSVLANDGNKLQKGFTSTFRP